LLRLSLFLTILRGLSPLKGYDQTQVYLESLFIIGITRVKWCWSRMKKKFICVRVETPDHIDPREHLEEVITTGIDLASFKDSKISFVSGKSCASSKKRNK